MKKLKVLVACEESQRVCTAFRELGHEAYSCDIQEPSGGHPEWHILGDVLEILNPSKTWNDIVLNTMDGEEHCVSKWDLIIAHPPCTYLSNAGACRLYPKKGELNRERYGKGLQAKEFFMQFLNADCEHIAVENPIPTKIYDLPPYTQIIQLFLNGGNFFCSTLNRRTNNFRSLRSVKMNNKWIRYDTNRKKSEIFVCPHCKGRVYYRNRKSGQCEYKFCPHCGKAVITNGL